MSNSLWSLQTPPDPGLEISTSNEINIREIFQKLLDLFWNEQFWLPPDVTWQRVKEDKGLEWANPDDLWTYPFIIMVAMLFVRYLLLDPFVFTHTALYCGLTTRTAKQPPPNKTLERLYVKTQGRISNKEVLEVSKTEGMTTRQVERWLRVRSKSDNQTRFKKFKDCAWQLTFYTFYTIYGCVIMYDKSWTYDTQELWRNYPHHCMGNDMWWYYMLSAGYYYSSIISLYFEHRQKDFYQMQIHHVCTIFLLITSYCTNYYRVGSVILLLHECSDIPLMSAKMIGYSGRTGISDCCFVVFLILWMFTRIYWFPAKIISSGYIEGPMHILAFEAAYYFLYLVLLLFFMHCMWTYFIFRVILYRFAKGELYDTRSDSELSESEKESRCNNNDKIKSS